MIPAAGSWDYQKPTEESADAKTLLVYQAGYGNPPGNNFLSDKADIYYSLGAGLKWNIYDWGKNSNERKTLAIQQQLLEIRRGAAEESLQRMLTLEDGRD